MDDWKAKYYASLTELDKKEKEFQQSEEVLRSMIAHLTRAADRRLPELNHKLRSLNTAITGGMSATRLKGAANEIEQSVEQMEMARNAGDALHAQHMVNLITQVKPAGSIEKPLGALGKELRKSKTPVDLGVYTEQLASLLVEGLNNSEAPAAEPAAKGGLFGGLLGGKKKETAPEPEPEPEQLSPPEQEKVVADLGGVFDLSAVGQGLYDLLDTFELSGQLQLEAQLIQRSLLNNLTEDSLLQGLNDSLRIVGAMLADIQQEKRDIEAFLAQITDRLQEMDVDLRASAKLREESRQQNEALTVTVGSDVSDIEQGIDSIQDLAEMKTVLQARVVKLRNNMDDFLNREQDRNRASMMLIEQLNDKVQRMEKESDGLREQLEQKRQLALRDALTEVPNRLAYQERIDLEMARFRRQGQPFVMLVWDIDKFKSINDTYGHGAGDKVLKMVAATLQKGLRESDFLARLGGEEFIVLLPDTDLDGAATLAEKLRASVEAIEFHSDNQPVAITISCGYGLVQEREEADALFERVDQALYAAKEGGRNRCVVSN